MLSEYKEFNKKKNKSLQLLNIDFITIDFRFLLKVFVF